MTFLNLFAQAAPGPSAESLKSWLEVLMYFAVIISAVSVAWKHLSGRSGQREIQQPLEIKAHQAWATKAEVDQLRTEIRTELNGLGLIVDRKFTELDRKRSDSIRDLHKDLESKTDALRTEMKADLGCVHDRVNDVLTAVAGVSGEIKHLAPR